MTKRLVVTKNLTKEFLKSATPEVIERLLIDAIVATVKERDRTQSKAFIRRWLKGLRAGKHKPLVFPSETSGTDLGRGR